MRSSLSSDNDVLIAGGGPAGLSLAALLGTEGFRVTVIEAAPILNAAPTRDLRTTAIALAGKRLLAAAKVWPRLSRGANAIEHIRIADTGRAGALDFHAAEVGSEPFGWIVENAAFRAALLARLRSLRNVRILAGQRIENFSAATGEARLTLADGRKLAAPLLVGCDGRHSFCRQAAGIRAFRLPYEQTAIVATLAHENPHQNVALEHFLPAGPFALLPMRGRRSALVWTERPQSAARLMQWGDDDFAAAVMARAGTHWGKMRLVGARASYPLSFLHAERYVAPRLALVGEAAHAMHPIAGQGFNMSLRDIADLAALLKDARSLGLDLGDPSLLKRYETARRPDTIAMLAATDGLDRLFSTSLKPIARLRRLGLRVVGKSHRLKQFFMREAMGLK